jgi:hypothetical protein
LFQSRHFFFLLHAKLKRGSKKKMDVTFPSAALPAAAPKEGTLKKVLDYIKNNKLVWVAIAVVAYWLYTKFVAKKAGFGTAANQQQQAPPVVAVNVPAAPLATDPNFTRLSSA